MAIDTIDTLALLGVTTPFTIGVADGNGLRRYAELRRRVFVDEQGMFAGTDVDAVDDDRQTVVLVARDGSGEVLGGVRLAPVTGLDLGWWQGSRLVVDRAAPHGVGRALVRAACATAEANGAIRFDATVQRDKEDFFGRLGWEVVGAAEINGHAHTSMRWPIDRFARLARSTKGWLGGLLRELRPGGDGFVGDDAAPVPGADLVAATDAILPSMVEREPEWAGWCSVLVNVNDLAAMGAVPVGILDALGARNADTARRILAGLSAAAAAYGVPVLGGHTQLGVPPSLSVTALGRTPRPIPAGGGRPGDVIRLTADLGGGWRPGYHGRQWDSTTSRSAAELRELLGWVATARPRAAKDVSMAGLVGTLGMLAEASGCGAEIDVAAVPRPSDARLTDWLSCFPGFAMLTAHEPGQAVPAVAPATSAVCGRLVEGSGVTLVWPDGARIRALEGAVTGLGAA